MADFDLRQWLEAVNDVEPVKVITGAHWHLEIGAITKLVEAEARKRASLSIPVMMFDEIVGYPKGFRVLVHPLESLPRLAFSLGFPKDIEPVELVAQWKSHISEVRPIAPVQAKDGKVKENVDQGSRINLGKFPAPRWHERDGGRYIGTGCVFITRDPDEGWVNLGTYRAMTHDDKNLGFLVDPPQHGSIHIKKYHSMGRPCPMAISVGQHPLITLVGSLKIPWGLSEYDFLGGLLNQPVKVLPGITTGLPVPADAELIIEGECLPDETKLEGPFGEWTGYYGSAARPEPVIRVTSVMYRDNPIITGMPPYKGGRLMTNFLLTAGIWEELEKAGIPGVRGVWCCEAAGGHLITVVSIKQLYPGHVRQTALVAIGCRTAATLGRYTIVVDEDIDPSNISDVLWAVATRSDPERSLEVIRRLPSSPLDPAVVREKGGVNSRAIIDACRPFEWRQEFAEVVEVSEELRIKTWAKWKRDLEGLFSIVNSQVSS